MSNSTIIFFHYSDFKKEEKKNMKSYKAIVSTVSLPSPKTSSLAKYKLKKVHVAQTCCISLVFSILKWRNSEKYLQFFKRLAKLKFGMSYKHYTFANPDQFFSSENTLLN